MSGGDPGVAFGPVPDAEGRFSWANGSRLYYANLAANFSTLRSEQVFMGFEAVAVSRIDAPASTGLTPAIISDQANWLDPVIVTRQNAVLFSDKEQVWADNAASSPFFGNVYVCDASFRSLSRGAANPHPVTVSVSSDGGNTWRTRQVTPAPANAEQGFRQGCTVRTDSHGVVYVFDTHFAVGTPGLGAHTMIKSFDGVHLAVVDPGVGSDRRARVHSAHGSRSRSSSRSVGNGHHHGGAGAGSGHLRNERCLLQGRYGHRTLC